MIGKCKIQFLNLTCHFFYYTKLCRTDKKNFGDRYEYYGDYVGIDKGSKRRQMSVRIHIRPVLKKD